MDDIRNSERNEVSCFFILIYNSTITLFVLSKPIIPGSTQNNWSNRKVDDGIHFNIKFQLQVSMNKYGTALNCLKAHILTCIIDYYL